MTGPGDLQVGSADSLESQKQVLNRLHFKKHMSPSLLCKWVHLYHFSINRVHIYALIDDVCFSLMGLMLIQYYIYNR